MVKFGEMIILSHFFFLEKLCGDMLSASIMPFVTS